MKPKLPARSLAIILFVINISITHAQDWSWKWAESISSQNPIVGYGPGPMACDYFNNNYFVAIYTNTLVLPDTTFYHANQNQYSYKCRAVLKYSPNGDYQNALDMYVNQEGMLPNMDFGIDNQLDMYISLSFSQGFNIMDSIFEPYYWQTPQVLDGLVIKLSQDSQIIWAKYIGGYGHDHIYNSIVTAEGDIYMNTMHEAGEWGTQVIFFDQDTIFSTDQFSTVCKLDKNGNLVWLLDFYGIVNGYHLEMGENGKLIWWGNASTDIIHGTDTTYKPSFPIYYDYPFCATIALDGYIEDIRFIAFPGIYISNYAMSVSGEKYITAIAHDTAVLLGDTTIIPFGYYKLIGKLNNQFEPLWYYIIPRINNDQQLGVVNFALDEDDLVFTFATNDDLYIADTVMPINNGFEGFFGEFDTDGNLNHIIRTESNNLNYPIRMMLDNCKNPVIGGSFVGTSILGNDTITSWSSSFEDIYIAKIERNVNPVNLGPDTLACAEHSLYGPAGYLYYSWNDIITNQSSYTTTETGTITFACANEDGCWLYDTINVEIHPGFTIDLGPDTSLFQNESIIFTVPEGYESYLWSNTVTANSISVFGDSYPPGTIKKIWVQVTDGPCIISDTVYVTIKSEFAVDDKPDNSIFLYPNPSDGFVYIKANGEINQIEICDLNGSALFTMEIHSPPGEMIKISLNNLNRGVYILKLNYQESQAIKKIIKL